MWAHVSLGLLVIALFCCIFTAAKGEAKGPPLWVSVLIVILALLVTYLPRGG